MVSWRQSEKERESNEDSSNVLATSKSVIECDITLVPLLTNKSVFSLTLRVASWEGEKEGGREGGGRGLCMMTTNKAVLCTIAVLISVSTRITELSTSS